MGTTALHVHVNALWGGGEWGWGVGGGLYFEGRFNRGFVAL